MTAAEQRISVQTLLDYKHERQRVYLARKAGKPFPWTTDIVLRNYRLENVYREQDRETIWLREHWREQYPKHPNLWFACCLFRLINWSPTLAEIGFPEKWDPQRVLKVLEDRLKRGDKKRKYKTFTSAYRVQHRFGGTKPRHAVHVLDQLWRQTRNGQNMPPWKTDSKATLEASHKWLSQFDGFHGEPGFMAYEVVTDLRHTRYLRNAPDINMWANTGPGANRGICLLLGIDPKTKIPAAQQLAYLRLIHREIDRLRDRTILPTLEMRDVEHSLCAFQKWQRAHEAIRTNQRVTLDLFHPPRNRLI